MTLLTLSSASAWWIFGDDKDNTPQYTMNLTNGTYQGAIYGSKSLAGDSYSIGISADGKVLYFNDSMAKKAGVVCPDFKNALALQTYKYFEITTQDYEFEDVNFIVNYTDNVTVGSNKNATVVTEVMYSNGTVVSEEDVKNNTNDE